MICEFLAAAAAEKIRQGKQLNTVTTLTGNHIINYGGGHNELTHWSVDNSRTTKDIHGNTERRGGKGATSSQGSGATVSEGKSNGIGQHDREECSDNGNDQTPTSNKSQGCQVNVDTCFEDQQDKPV